MSGPTFGPADPEHPNRIACLTLLIRVNTLEATFVPHTRIIPREAFPV
jgi:hypothetical protein